MANDPTTQGDTSTAPTPIEVLRWCERAAPGLWFPGESTTAEVSRDSLLEPTRVLREAGLIVVGDWVKGRGQGYRLTTTGKAALRESAELPPAIRPGQSTPNRGQFDREVITRLAFDSPRPAIVSPAILTACVVWFAAGLWIAHRLGVSPLNYIRDGDYRVLLKLGAVHGPEIHAGEWWRLLTSCFVHIGAVHLLANLFSLGMVGPLAEGLWGRKRFVVLFFASGIASSAAAAAINPNAVTAGASGAIWGLQTAVLLWVLRFRRSMPDGLFSEWLKRLLLVIGVNAVISFAPGISWESHLAGGLVGFTAGAFLDWTRSGVGRRQRLGGAAGLAALLVAVVGGFIAATYSSPEWIAIRRPEASDAKRRADATETVKRLNELRPSVLRNLQQKATVVLLFRKPGQDGEALTKLNESVAEIDRRLGELFQLYAASPIEITNAARDYAMLAAEFLTRIRSLVAKPTMPTGADWAPVAETLDRADEVWRKLAAP